MTDSVRASLHLHCFAILSAASTMNWNKHPLATWDMASFWHLNGCRKSASEWIFVLIAWKQQLNMECAWGQKLAWSPSSRLKLNMVLVQHMRASVQFARDVSCDSQSPIVSTRGLAVQISHSIAFQNSASHNTIVTTSFATGVNPPVQCWASGQRQTRVSALLVKVALCEWNYLELWLL